VPVEDLRKSDVLRERHRSARIDWAKRGGKRIRHTHGGIRIREIGIRNVHDRSERRNTDNIFERYPIGCLVIIACSTANAGLGIGRQLVCKAHARANIAQVVVDGGCGTSSIVMTSAEDQVLRRIGVAHRLRSGHKTRHSSVAIRVREEWIPAYADVHCEPRSRMPVVLYEETPVVSAKIKVQTPACVKLDTSPRRKSERLSPLRLPPKL